MSGPELLQRVREQLAEHRTSEALDQLNHWLADHADDAGAWYLLAQAYDQRHWLFHQARSLEQTQKLWPAHAESRYELLRAYNRLGLQPQLAGQLQRLLGRPYRSPRPAHWPSSPREGLLVRLSHYHELLAAYADPAVGDTALFDLIDRLPPPARRLERRPPVDPRPHRRLRIGYLSPEYGQSVTMHLLAPLLAHHGPDVELIAYDDTPPRPATPDHRAALARLQPAFAAWRRAYGIDNAALAEQIRADRIDILVDLIGIPNAWRYGLMALHPAPVQFSGLGFVFSSACPDIDYCFSDAVLCPPPIAARYPETVQLLPAAFHWQAPPQAGPPDDPPCLQNGYVTFGSANTLNKLNPRVIGLWCELLRQLPTARLFLKTPAFDDPLAVDFYRQLFVHFGADPQRLRFEGQGEQPHMAYFYPQIDIALDAFPYQGGVTSCEALWMGVPLVSLLTPQWRSRALGASVLTAAGKATWLATDETGYLEQALTWARDQDFLIAQRHSLRPALLASPICDGAGATALIEAAYRQAWQLACAGG